MSTGTDERARLHRLIDSLRADDLPAVQRVLEALNTSDNTLPAVLRDAPFDDEPETDEEREAVAQARREIEQGETISHEEVKRRLQRS